jgi:hypothetical protein
MKMYSLTTKWLWVSLFGRGNTLMNALAKENVKAPVRPTGKKPSAREMFERMMSRYPKTMARLAE